MLHIERMNAKYKISGDKGRKQLDFAPGDLVWLHLRKEWFPNLRKSKLMPRADGPFKVLENINENSSKLDLPTDFGVSPTFNIADLKPYLGEEDVLESRTTQMQEGEDDMDINTSDTSTPTHNQIFGSITWAHARQLNNQVSSFLASYSSYLFQNPNLIVFSASKLYIHLTIQCLFYLFLLVLRLLVGQVPSWLGCHAPQDHVDHESWCIGR
jgi:hypothetical protein